MNYRIYYNRENGKKVQTIVAATAVPTMQEVVCFQELYGEFEFFVMSREEFQNKFTREFEGLPFTKRKELEKRTEIAEKTRRIEVKDEIEVSDEVEKTDLFRFLDADTAAERISILLDLKQNMDDKLLDDIAVCLDIVWEDGVDKFEFILQHLELQKKYESGRFR